MNTVEYLDHGTWLHRLDPRTKLLLFGTEFTLMALFADPLWVAPVTVLIALQVLASRSFVNVMQLRYLLFMLAVTGLVMWSLFSDGTTPLFLFIEVESLAYAVSRTLLIASTIVLGVLFVSTTRNEEFVLALIKVGLPYRVGFVISTALRLVPMIISHTATIGQAQRSRGLNLDTGNILQRIRKFMPLLIPVFASTIRSSGTLSMALEAKGFGAYPRRTFYLQLTLHPLDYALTLLSFLILGLAIYLKATGHGEITSLTRF